jgi:hypothetical protein
MKIDRRMEMVFSDEARSLLQGSYDLHIHSAPDLMPRKSNDLGFARRAAAAGMAGILVKSHFTSTADRAALVGEVVPDVQVYGALCLNHSSGGINPIAVETAGRSGARLVWFPTVDARNELEHMDRYKGISTPFWYAIAQELREKGMAREPIYLLDEAGKLLPEVYQVLEVIARYNMVLATGHIGIEEIRALVKAAKGAGVRRIVLTHPDLPSIAMPFDLQAELAKQGVLMERTYMINFSGKVTLDYTFAATRAAGVAGCFLSTDFGQPKSPWPDEGFGEFIQHFLDAGFTRDEVRTMVYDNPAGLVSE